MRSRHHHRAHDHAFVRSFVVEKRSPPGDPRSTRAINCSPTPIPKTPPSGRGFLLVPSPAHPQGDGTMTDLRQISSLQGLWLPLVTPFRDGELDEASLRRLVRHYAAGPVDGLILAATSGEGMSLGVGRTRAAGGGDAQRDYPAAGATCRSASGLSGASTAKMLDALDETAAWPIDGYLIASPYYIAAVAARPGAAFHRARRSRLVADRALQHPLPHRGQPHQRDAAGACRASEHRRHEGLLRRPRAVDRLPGAAAVRLSRADRRGRAVSRRAHRRRRRRDPAVGASRDRSVRLGADAA